MKRTAAEERVYAANKKMMYGRDGWHCRHCRRSDSLTPHHIIFQSHGGTDSLNNLITLCLRCHNAIHDGHLKLVLLTVEDFDVVVKFQRLKGWKS